MDYINNSVDSCVLGIMMDNWILQNENSKNNRELKTK
jgi:hypothetical protein